MSTVPRTYPEAIDWVNTHVPIWGAVAADIGLDPLKVAELGTLASAASTAHTAYLESLGETRAKALAYRSAARAMRTMASGQVVQIRGFARTSADPAGVYEDAQIPEPAKPSPAPAPGTPTGFKAQLLESGNLKFTFDCEHPAKVAGVTYKVLRQLAPQDPYQFLQNAKGRSFEDNSITGDSREITYIVTAQTSTKDGNPAYFTVRFGAGNQASIIAQGPVATSEAG